MPETGLSEVEWRVQTPVHERSDVAIYVNGIPLIDLVKQFEECMGYRPAGEYGWCPARYTLAYPRHFMGEARWKEDRGRVVFLFCSCKAYGCWSLNGRIELAEGLVRWFDFEQTHRPATAGARHWDYATFGPFCFERTQYEASLARAQSVLDVSRP